MRVLLVEDDRMIGEAVEAALRTPPTRWTGCATGRWRSKRWPATGTTSLLDLGLPRKDGLEVLRSIRGRDDAVPVLIVTARDALEDRIAGLDAGADDYVLKPFEMAELLARMRAVARRRVALRVRCWATGCCRSTWPPRW